MTPRYYGNDPVVSGPRMCPPQRTRSRDLRAPGRGGRGGVRPLLWHFSNVGQPTGAHQPCIWAPHRAHPSQESVPDPLPLGLSEAVG